MRPGKIETRNLSPKRVPRDFTPFRKKNEKKKKKILVAPAKPGWY